MTFVPNEGLGITANQGVVTAVPAVLTPATSMYLKRMGGNYCTLKPFKRAVVTFGFTQALSSLLMLSQAIKALKSLIKLSSQLQASTQ